MKTKKLKFKGKLKEKKLKRKKYTEKAKERRRLASKAKNNKSEKHLWGWHAELNSEFLAINKTNKKNKIKKIL